jgi:hypothetical protein
MADPNRSASAAPEEPEGGERRESDRVPVQLLVRDLGTGGSFEARDGNLALGGVYYEALHPPVGGRVELRFILPGAQGEVRAVGEVLRVSREGPRFGAHVKFAEIPLDDELAIARFLQGK